MRSCINDLRGLKHLDKVVVVWNNPVDPPSNTTWPHIGAPIVVSILTYSVLFTVLFTQVLNVQRHNPNILSGAFLTFASKSCGPSNTAN